MADPTSASCNLHFIHHPRARYNIIETANAVRVYTQRHLDTSGVVLDTLLDQVSGWEPRDSVPLDGIFAHWQLGMF
jgi:hypothetical protein